MQVVRLMEEKKEHHEHAHEHHAGHKSHKKKSLNLENALIGVAILLAIVVIYNITTTLDLNKGLKKTADAAQEKSRAANIQLYVITDLKCADCFDISIVESYIRQLNVNVTRHSQIDFSSKEGKGFIAKYNITRVPSIVVAGETEKAGIQGLEKVGDALVLKETPAPYTNPASGKIEGRVSLQILKDPSCAKCNDLSGLIAQIKATGVKFSQEKTISSSTDEGKQVIEKYNINFVPTLIMSKDAAAYPIIQQAWLQVGSKEKDGSYVLRLVSPPFINLTTGQLRGLVDIMYLVDKSCTECYNVSVHREILASPQSFSVKLEKEEAVDISESKGKELIAKYNITQVPTVLLSADISAYPSTQALKQFFSVEKDGSYIFRKVSVVGNYKDLTTNQIVTVPVQPVQKQ